MTRPIDKPLSIAVLISGNGSNLQAIIDAATAQQIPVRIACVISSNPNAHGLLRAQLANIPQYSVDYSQYDNSDLAEQALLAMLKPYEIDIIALAGFMRILSADVVQQYPGRIINIHPSLLPQYPGLNTYQRVLASGDKLHGATIHLVTEELDAGPILSQHATPILPGDTEDSLSARIHTLEHELYPRTLDAIAQYRSLIHDSEQFVEQVRNLLGTARTEQRIHDAQNDERLTTSTNLT